MLKNKLRLLFIVLMIVCFTLSPLCFAVDEPENTEDEVTADVVENQADESEEQVAEQATEAEKEVQEEEAKITSSDAYLIGDKINIDYVVDGNLFVIANEVNIDAQILGNAFVMANKINITEKGYVSNSLFALADSIELDGVIYDGYISSTNLLIKGYVYRDLYSVTENFKHIGSIGRNVNAASKNFAFEQLENEGSDIEYASAQGRISGDFNYSTEHEITVPENVVEGKTNFINMPSVKSTNYVFAAISSIVFVLAIWLLFKWLAPKFLTSADTLITNKPLKTLGFGLLSLICIPIVATVLIIAGITSSVGLIALSVYLVLICISRATSIIAINNIISNKLKFEKSIKQFALLIATSLVAWAITLIPVVGALVNVAFVLVGMGIITRKLISKKDKETEE